MANAQEKQQHLHNEFRTVDVGMLLWAYVALCFILGSRLLRKQLNPTTFSSTKKDNVIGPGQLLLELTVYPIVISTLISPSYTGSQCCGRVKVHDFAIIATTTYTIFPLAGVFGAYSFPCWISPCWLLGCSCRVLIGRKLLDLNPYSELVAFLAVCLLARQLTRTLWRFIFTKVINSSRTLLSTSSDQSHKEKVKRWKRTLDLVFKHLVWTRIVPLHRRTTQSDRPPSTGQRYLQVAFV